MQRLLSLLLLLCLSASSVLAVHVRSSHSQSLPADASLQIHLALCRQGAGVSVTWSTKDNSTAPLVQFGLSASSLTSSSIDPAQNTYGYSWYSTVDLYPLQPSTRYYYQIVNPTNNAPISLVHSFMSAPKDNPNGPISVAVLGDLGVNFVNLTAKDPVAIDKFLKGYNLGAAYTMKLARNLSNYVDFFYHLGDISYADDTILQPFHTYEDIWNEWGKQMSSVTAEKIYQTMPGNHEVLCNEVLPFTCTPNTKNFSAYRHRFHMHGEESGGYGNMWYSFDYGIAHFVALNTETDYPDAKSGPGSWLNSPNLVGTQAQIDWLKSDLAKAAANRENVPWIIVGGHRPFYGRKSQCEPCRAAFEDLFIQYDVDFYLAGHVHAYERMYPIGANGTMPNGNSSSSYNNPTAPVHIINGAAGCPEGFSDFKNPDIPPYSALFLEAFGMAKFDFLSAEKAVWTYYNATSGAIADQFTVTKQRNYKL